MGIHVLRSPRLTRKQSWDDDPQVMPPQGGAEPLPGSAIFTRFGLPIVPHRFPPEIGGRSSTDIRLPDLRRTSTQPALPVSASPPLFPPQRRNRGYPALSVPQCCGRDFNRPRRDRAGVFLFPSLSSAYSLRLASRGSLDSNFLYSRIAR